MRRALLPLLTITVILLAGCSQAASPEDTLGDTVATQGSAGGSEGGSAGAPTYQAVILGPGAEPVASADVAPRIFRDEPSLSEALKTAVPADIAGRSPGMPGHLVVAMAIAGAAETGAGVEVYADLHEDRFSLEGGKPVENGGGSYPVRIRLTEVNGVFRVDGVDRPKDGAGYNSSLDEMFPGWVRGLVNKEGSYDRLHQAIRDAVIEWTGQAPTEQTTTTAGL